MEEDAAKLIHAGGEAGRIAGSDYSMVDFNRGGTPLIEIVGEPDIPSPEAAREFLQQLRNLVDRPRRERVQHGGGPDPLGRQHQRAARRQRRSWARAPSSRT